MNWEEIGKNLLNFLKELLTTAGLRILYAVLIIVIGLKLIKFFAKRCEKTKWYRKIDKSVAHFIVSSLNIILKVLVFPVQSRRHLSSVFPPLHLSRYSLPPGLPSALLFRAHSPTLQGGS